MQIIHGTRHLDQPFHSSVLTIGNFDGVHLGHRALIARTVERARELKIPSILMTFEPHPVKVLYPDRKLHRIFALDDLRIEVEKLGIDVLIVEPFSREFSQVSPDRYLSEWIYRPFQPETLVVGYDFSFGANRQGSIAVLKQNANDLGFHLEVIPPVKVDDVVVSSTRIRTEVEGGNVKLANLLLARPFYISGLVERGAGRGKTIGIPTANLRTTAELLPARGVYAAWATIGANRLKAMVNVGLNPTFTEGGHQPLTIEAHLLDFDQDIYGDDLKLEFVDRLRDERKFASVPELVQQIRTDIVNGEKILGG